MKNNKKKDWKLFEETVAQIEEALSPKGAVVKSPDRVIDNVTKQIREVDASIRYIHNSLPIFITVECRDRKRVQDDMWIEQLVTKQEKIGASKTIAVSSNGFTKPAMLTAKKYGIELRTCEKVSDEGIEAMLSGIGLSAVYIFRHLIDLQLRVETKDKPNGVVKKHLQEKINKHKENVVLAHTENGDQEVRLNNLLDIISEATKESVTEKVNGNNLVLKIKVNKDSLYYSVDTKKYGVREIILTVKFYSELKNIPFDGVYNYCQEKTPIAQHLQASLNLDEKTRAEFSFVRR